MAALEELSDQYEGAKPAPKPKPQIQPETEPSETVPTAEPEAGLVVESEDMELKEALEGIRLARKTLEELKSENGRELIEERSHRVNE